MPTVHGGMHTFNLPSLDTGTLKTTARKGNGNGLKLQRPRRCLHADNKQTMLSHTASRGVGCFVHSAAEPLVHSGETPMGKGLISYRGCQKEATLLQVPLAEAVAVTHRSRGPETGRLAAESAYWQMPSKVQQFVQGVSEHPNPMSHCNMEILHRLFTV